MKILLLFYLQILYTIGAFQSKRTWIDGNILWCHKTLDEKFDHKVEFYYTPKNE